MQISSADIDAVVFDVGNVLVEIDFHRVFASWAHYAQCPQEQIAERYAHDHHYENHERGEISAREYFAALRENLDINISDEQFFEGWNQIFVGEVPTIRQLTSHYSTLFPIYAFSNSNETHKAVWISRYSQLLQPFKQVFVSCDIGKRKPDTDAYLHVADAIGTEPRRILFFDDSQQNIEGAQRVGMHAKKIDSVADMEAVLRNLR
ncbi:HAD family hydrolase [Kaarinaea lacus]